MPLFGPVWRKFGDRGPTGVKRCTPAWRFEGRAIFPVFTASTGGGTGGIRWKTMENVGYIQLHGRLNGFSNWDNPFANVFYGSAHCFQNGFIRQVELNVIENLYPHDFEVGLYEDERMVSHFFDVLEGETGRFSAVAPTNLSGHINVPIRSGRNYAIGWKTKGGEIPSFDHASRVMRLQMGISVFWGAGDP